MTTIGEYKLSVARVALAELVCSGRDIADIAHRIGVRPETLSSFLLAESSLMLGIAERLVDLRNFLRSENTELARQQISAQQTVNAAVGMMGDAKKMFYLSIVTSITLISTTALSMLFSIEPYLRSYVTKDEAEKLNLQSLSQQQVITTLRSDLELVRRSKTINISTNLGWQTSTISV